MSTGEVVEEEKAEDEEEAGKISGDISQGPSFPPLRKVKGISSPSENISFLSFSRDSSHIPKSDRKIRGEKNSLNRENERKTTEIP